MNFIKRLKNDKTFRFKFVLVLALFMIVINSGAKKEATDQATCDTKNSLNPCSTPYGMCMYNIPATSVYTSGDAMQCKALECKVGNSKSPLNDQGVCFSCVPAGYYVQAIMDCCSQDAVQYDADEFLCKAVNPDNPVATCNAAEQTIANIVYGMGLKSLSCKMAYYLVIFGGAMVLFLVMGMMF